MIMISVVQLPASESKTICRSTELRELAFLELYSPCSAVARN